MERAVIGALLTSLVLTGCGTKTHEIEDGGSDDDTGTPELIDVDQDGFDTTQDCNDDDPAVNPNALEICDGIDNDCDLATDEGLLNSYYVDVDGDSFGDPDAGVVERCELEKGLVENADDCDDDDFLVNPDGTELCNDIDDDCDDSVDEPDAEDATEWFMDADGDSWGDADVTTVACDMPADHAAIAGDCNDDDEAVNPDMIEVCNDIDDDCDDDIDSDAVDASTWYVDEDGDRWGSDADTVVQCDEPAGYEAKLGDCDDDDAEVNPDAHEICDLIDNDCDGSTGEDGMVTFWGEDGSVVDMTSYFDGTYSSPSGWNLGADGSFNFCRGTYYTYLSLQADIEMVGLYGSDETILSAGDRYSVISVEDAGVDATMEGFTLQDGSSHNWWDPGRTYVAGGGVFCGATANLGLTDVRIDDSSADLGGGIYIEGCNVELDEVTISGSSAQYGGAIALWDGDLQILDSTLSGNAAEFSGGAMYLDGTDRTVTASMNRTVVEENEAQYGGGVALFEATFACVGDSSVEAGFFDNGGTLGAAAFIEGPDSFRSTSCDWGDGSRDNTGDDIYISPNENVYEYSSDESFTCTSSMCS